MALKKKKSNRSSKQSKAFLPKRAGLTEDVSEKTAKTSVSSKQQEEKGQSGAVSGAESRSKKKHEEERPSTGSALSKAAAPVTASESSERKTSTATAATLTERTKQTQRILSAIMLAEVDRTEPFATDELHKAFNSMEEAIAAWGTSEQKALENLGLHHNLHQHLKENVLCHSQTQSSQILRASKVCAAMKQIQDAIKHLYRGKYRPHGSLTQSLLGPFMDLFNFVANPSAFADLDMSAHKDKLKFLVGLLGTGIALSNLKAYEESRRRRRNRWF